MLDLSRKVSIESVQRSAMNEEWRGVRARFVKSEIAVGAACLAVAFLVPDGYPRLVALSVVSLCSYAWILRVCQCE